MPKVPQQAETPAVQAVMRGGRALGMSSAALAILEALNHGPMSQQELEEVTELTRATLSKHLLALEEADFVSASIPREGRRGRSRTTWTLERGAVARWLDSVRRLVASARVSEGGHASHHRDDEHHNAQ